MGNKNYSNNYNTIPLLFNYKIIIIIIINYGMAYSNFTRMIIARESSVLVTPSH